MPSTPALKPAAAARFALCAAARKLVVLAWHLLSKDEDYRYAAATITQRKLRTLQRTPRDPGPLVSLAAETKRKTLERRLLEEAERNYRAHVSVRAKGAGAITGEATLSGPRGANDARQARSSPKPALLDEVTRARTDPIG